MALLLTAEDATSLKKTFKFPKKEDLIAKLNITEDTNFSNEEIIAFSKQIEHKQRTGNHGTKESPNMKPLTPVVVKILEHIKSESTIAL